MAKEDNIADRYAQRGVSSQKEDVHKAIRNVDKGLFPKAFCKIVEDVYSKEEDPWCSVMHADGAGTKSSLAYAYCHYFIMLLHKLQSGFQKIRVPIIISVYK